MHHSIENEKKEKEIRINKWCQRKKELSNNWIENKIKLRKRGIIQGGIYLCELGENVGSEQNSNPGEDRPVIVISNNTINSTSNNVIIAPLSKTLKYKSDGKTPKYKSHYFLYKEKYSFLSQNSAVKTEEVRTVSKVRLNKKLGEVEPQDLKKIMKRADWTIEF